MRRLLIATILVIAHYAAAANAAVFADSCSSVDRWDVLDLNGDGGVSVVGDRSCPPGFGPRVLHVKGDRLLLMAKDLTIRDGTILALYRENDPRDADADGILLLRAQYGMDLHVEHNTKTWRPWVAVEQDNDSGLHFRHQIDSGDERILAQRPGYGIVTDAWNRTGWIWQKARMEGDRLLVKYWPAELPEPAEWGIETTFSDLRDGRAGVAIVSGDINLAYVAADTNDIPVRAPDTWLSFPGRQATQADRIDLALYTVSDRERAIPLRITVTASGRIIGEASTAWTIPRGTGTFPIVLTTRSDALTDGAVVRLDAAPPSGSVEVAVTGPGLSATATFDYLEAGEMQRQLDSLSSAIRLLSGAIDNAPPGSDPDEVGELGYIRDAASAHIARATSLLREGDIDAARLTLRFAVEALGELSGFRGVWLRRIAPDVAFPEFARDSGDRRGIRDPAPNERVGEAWSPKFRLSFGAPVTDAQALVMGGSYVVDIPWSVEGMSLDRDFTFSVRLASPLLNRIAASSTAQPEVPTSRWTPGRVYTQRCTLVVLTEAPPPGSPRPSSARVLDEYHWLLVSVIDPATGATLLLGNGQGDHSGPYWREWTAGQFYVASTPLEIRGFAPEGSGALDVRTDRARVRNVGSDTLSATAVFTVLSETERVIHLEARQETLAPGDETELAFVWTPRAAGAVRLRLRFVREDGTTVTEARRDIALVFPPGYDVRVERRNAVVRDTTRGNVGFSTPVVVSVGRRARMTVEVRTASARPFGTYSNVLTIKPQDFPAQRVVGRGRAETGEVVVYAEPWHGYYDVAVDLGAFRYERRIVATVVETSGMDILVNGEPFIVKGLNVHGLESSPERAAAAIRVYRDLGFNTMRGDGPQPWQVDLAYEMGVVYTNTGITGCTSTDATFGWQTGGMLDMLREKSRLVALRHRDHAGFLLWLSANEVVGETIDMLESTYPVYKAFDPCRRPVHYSNLYGQDYWQGQDVMGVNYYSYIRGASDEPGTARQPVIQRSIDVARAHSLPIIYDEFNSWAGAIHSTGAAAVRDFYSWGIDRGMAGGIQYMYLTFASHPGVVDENLNTYAIYNDALIAAFADADVTLDRSSERSVTLKVRNRRRCWLRNAKLSVIVSGVGIDPIAIPDLVPLGIRYVEIPLPADTPGPARTVDGSLTFTTHHGFPCRIPVRIVTNAPGSR